MTPNDLKRDFYKLPQPKYLDADLQLEDPVLAGGQGRSDEQVEEHADACLLVVSVLLAALFGALLGYAIFALLFS